jgi:hypothetical protein
LPAFGLAREHQERMQRLAKAQSEYQQRTQEYSAQLALATKLAFERFEAKLGERSEPGRQIDSARALFDVWIDAAEEAWSEVAMSEEYRVVYGDYVNAQMALRIAVVREVEQMTGALGLPTRSEVDGSHRKLAALEREVRRLKSQLAERAEPASASVPPTAARKSPSTGVKPGSGKKSASSKQSKTRKKRATAEAVRRTTSSRSQVLPQVVAPRPIASAPKEKQASAVANKRSRGVR